MEHIETINQINQFKVLGDERRVKILRYLMAEPATLSQLGEKLGIHPANVRYHLKQLEVAGLVTLTATNVVRGFVEKYFPGFKSGFDTRTNRRLRTGSNHLRI